MSDEPVIVGHIRRALGLRGEVVVEPPRVRISGARSEVLRVSEVLTETIDLTGANAPLERKVRALPGVLHVWLYGAE